MIHPFKSIDRWASRSVDRTAFLMWIMVVVMALFVVLSIAGEVWYTAPRAVHHAKQGTQTEAPG